MSQKFTPVPLVLREVSLLSLLELSNELNAKRDLYDIADVALFSLMGSLGCPRGAFWAIPADRAQPAVLVRSPGINESVARALGTVWTRWLLERTEGVPEPMLVSELKGIMSSTGIALAEQNGISVVAPVSARREILGLVALGKRVEGTEFGSLEREVIQASLNLVGVAMQNTNLYNALLENNRRLRQANQSLEQLDGLKSEFLSNLNHELRTPLTIMIAYLEMIQNHRDDEAQREVHLQIVQEHCVKLQSLLINLLDFSKLQQEELELKIRRGDVAAILRDYHEERRPGISAGLREFRFSAPGDLPSALFDEQRVVQIIDSLVDNAVKFCPQGSIIHLRLDLDKDSANGNDCVQIDLIDNGPGIHADHLPRIFDSFYQVDGSSTRRHGGMGVGLAFARMLAQKMNGSLDVTSQIGKGTTFRLRLPAA